MPEDAERRGRPRFVNCTCVPRNATAHHTDCRRGKGEPRERRGKVFDSEDEQEGDAPGTHQPHL